MDDLISRSALLEKNMNVGLCDAYGDYYGCGDVVLTDDIKAAPAIDAVEVVRCEKCRYSQALPTNRESAFGVGVRHCRKGRGNNLNPFGLSTVSTNDFCSYGERKENEDN